MSRASLGRTVVQMLATLLVTATLAVYAGRLWLGRQASQTAAQQAQQQLGQWYRLIGDELAAEHRDQWNRLSTRPPLGLMQSLALERHGQK